MTNLVSLKITFLLPLYYIFITPVDSFIDIYVLYMFLYKLILIFIPRSSLYCKQCFDWLTEALVGGAVDSCGRGHSDWADH